MKEGTKYDKDKLRWDLIEFEDLEKIIKVYTFGAKKYGDNNWKKVKNAKERYFAAFMRHSTEYRKGNLIDEESKIEHLALAAWNALALMYFERAENE